MIIGTYRANPFVVEAALEGIEQYVHTEDGYDLVFVDDSGEPQMEKWLAKRGMLFTTGGRKGCYVAMGAVCDVATSIGGEVICFWEEDCVPVADIDLDRAARVLTDSSDCVQFAFGRQPQFVEEQRLGSVGKLYAEDSLPTATGTGQLFIGDGLMPYWSQRACFTGNPALWRKEAWASGWPQHPGAERSKTWELTAKGYDFAYTAKQYVDHRGSRDGRGY